MSLLDAFARRCARMEKTCVPDGAGGLLTAWAEGEEFTVYQALDSAMEARRADKEGVASVYTALVDQAVSLAYMDYYLDKASGRTYRVTSNPEERKAPQAAGATIRGLKCFTAERKELPT